MIKGNEFWKNRKTHGRKKLFTSADVLWKGACSYFEWCESHPFIMEVVKVLAVNGKGKEASRVKLEIIRPFTLMGLCLHLGVNTKYFNQFVVSDDPNDEVSQMVLKIKDLIYDQKFVGAAVGVFNANLISRDLGLKFRSKNLYTDNTPFLKHDPFETDIN